MGCMPEIAEIVADGSAASFVGQTELGRFLFYTALRFGGS